MPLNKLRQIFTVIIKNLYRYRFVLFMHLSMGVVLAVFGTGNIERERAIIHDACMLDVCFAGLGCSTGDLITSTGFSVLCV